MNVPLILKEIIEERKKLNPRLSLRALASKIGIPSGRLSEILNGKRKLTEAQIIKICEGFKLEESSIARLRVAFQTDRDLYNKGKKQKDSSEEKKSSSVYGELLDPQTVQKLVNWKPFAIMTYFQTETYLSDAGVSSSKEHHLQLIAKYLGLDKAEVSDLLTVMQGVHLIAWKDCRWIPTFEEATTGYDVPSKLIQNSHAQDLELALKRLDQVDVASRDFSSITLAINGEDILKAKKLIRNFRRSFAREMEKGSKKDVFQISIQFYPVAPVLK